MEAVVVKLGGSLIEFVPRLVEVIRTSERRVLVVPGGGIFADRIREWNPPPDAAHWMAIAAMEQFGHYIASFGIPPVEDPRGIQKTSVLLPYCLLRKKDPLPHSWDITSDTIAAWVAWYLDLPLLVLKSQDGIMIQGTMLKEVTEPLSTDTVDPAFPGFVLERGIRAAIINGREPGRVRRALIGDRLYGTLINCRTEEL